MRRKILTLTMTLLLTLVPLIGIVNQVQATVVSASDLINWMNSNRQANGFSPAVEDLLLDQSAASAAYDMYSQYANTYTCGHPGGKMERIAATGYGGGATFYATENIACASSADLAWFYNVWGDDLHQLPASDVQYTRIGAFAYTAPNGITYYVLHAASAVGDSFPTNNGSSGPTVTNDPNITPVIVNTVNAFPTSTPDLDGTIWHVVKANDTLYTIAVNYGTTIGAIKTLNNLTSDQIIPGDTLKISLKPTPTITPTRTSTVMMPTRTPTLYVTTTPSPTKTVTPTPIPTKVSVFQKIDRQYLGFGLLVLSAVGFFVVIFFFFLRPRFKK